MKLSRKFINDYIDLDENLSIKDIAEDMTRVGNEYDDASPLINCTNLTIGKVISCTDHPDSDHLHCCKVDIGTEVLDIVCGAPNVREGIKVIVALPGAKLPGGEIKKGVIRGQESNGMLCSISELGLDKKFLSEKDIEGIHELDENAPLGEDPIKYLELDDEVIDFELTSNRGDELSMLGLAYELGAIYNKKVKDIDLSYNTIEKSVKDEFNIDIQTDNCSIFLAAKVKNLEIKESPLFIKNRLIACGIRPINNVVDISNYVMLETGQPLHFYDASSLGNKLIVRMAKDNEKVTTLDDVERQLDSNDIVIANDKEPVGLAGVMGGLNTEVEASTKDIIIESAIFNASFIRKTSKKVLRSEASNRFEKGLDPNRTYMAIYRCLNLLEKYASGKVLKDLVIYDKANKDNKVISITTKNINDVLGTNIDISTIISVFNRLGFTVENNNDTLTVTVPSRRIDISIKEDLIEEVGRIYGINNIEGKLPNLGIKKGSYDKTTRQIRNKLVDLGLNEVLTQIFISEELGHLYTNDTYETVKLLDPLSSEKAYIRYSLIPSLMKVYDYNKRINNNDISIFEMGKGFAKIDNEYKEDYKLAILMTGEYFNEIGNNRKCDFYVLKGIVEQLLDFLGFNSRYNFNIDNNIPKELHPYQSASININGTHIGIMGKIHPNVTKDNVYVLEINLDKLLSIRTSSIKYKEIPKYLPMLKDVNFVIDRSISNEEVMKVIKKAGGKLLTNIKLFDIYTGEKIKDNEISLAYSLKFEDNTKTLTEEEVMNVFNKIIKEVTIKLNAKLREN